MFKLRYISQAVVLLALIFFACNEKGTSRYDPNPYVAPGTTIENGKIAVLCDACELPDHSIVTVGYSDSLSNGNLVPLMAKLTNRGDILWKKTLRDERVNSFRIITYAPDTDEFVVFGESVTGTYMLLITSQGEIAKRLPITVAGEDMFATEMLRTEDGDMILCGSTNTEPTKGAIVKFDATGQIKWERTFGSDSANVQITDAKKYQSSVVISAVYSTINPLPNHTSVLITMSPQTGDVVETIEILLNRAKVFAIAEHFDEGFLIAGIYVDSAVIGAETLVAQISTSGEIIWKADFRHLKYDRDHSDIVPVDILNYYGFSGVNEFHILGNRSTQPHLVKAYYDGTAIFSNVIMPVNSFALRMKRGTYTGYYLYCGLAQISQGSNVFLEASVGYVSRI